MLLSDRKRPQSLSEQDITLEYFQGISAARGTSSVGKFTVLPGQPAAEEFANCRVNRRACSRGMCVPLQSASGNKVNASAVKFQTRA
jgi:hypothetical protein